MSSSSSSEVEGTSPRPPSMTRGPRAIRRPPPPSPSSSRAPSRDEIEPREGTPLSSISEPKPTSAVVPPPFGRCLLRRSSSLPPPRAPFPRRGGRGAVTVLVFGMGSPPTCWRADGGGLKLGRPSPQLYWGDGHTASDAGSGNDAAYAVSLDLALFLMAVAAGASVSAPSRSEEATRECGRRGRGVVLLLFRSRGNVTPAPVNDPGP